MTDGQKQKFKEVMAVCQQASTRASRNGTDFNAPQAVAYTTISLTLYWAMAVLGAEPQNEMFKNFEELIARAKSFGIQILPPDFKG